jgi:hypothetical protein
MYAMQPVWTFLGRLEGFDFAAFWITAFAGVVISGFLIDYIMQRQGFGAIFNSLLLVLCIFVGLFVRFAYAKPNVVPLPDPMLTIAVILAVTTTMLTTLSMLRNRFW